MENNDLIDAITVNIRKYDCIDENYFKNAVSDCAGKFYPYIDDNKEIISLFYGDFFKELCKRFNRTIEEQTCYTLSHEFLHYVLLNEHNIKVSSRFDRIAENLNEYGVY